MQNVECRVQIERIEGKTMQIAEFIMQNVECRMQIERIEGKTMQIADFRMQNSKEQI